MRLQTHILLDAMRIPRAFSPPAGSAGAPRDAVDFSGSTVVVIDVLRATTTILQALAAGATRVIPCLEIDEALQLAASQKERCVLGGERGGKKIAGFDLGNSPAEYTPENVAGRTVIMTTTNGTRVMQSCRGAKRILLGGFVNISAVVRALSPATRADLVCAGTAGEETLEDTLFAGAVVSELHQCNIEIVQNEQSQIAAREWRTRVGGLDQRVKVVAAMRQSRGGQNLIELGYDADIELAARVDATPVLGELFLDEWEIRVANSSPL